MWKQQRVVLVVVVVERTWHVVDQQLHVVEDTLALGWLNLGYCSAQKRFALNPRLPQLRLHRSSLALFPSSIIGNMKIIVLDH